MPQESSTSVGRARQVRSVGASGRFGYRHSGKSWAGNKVKGHTWVAYAFVRLISDKPPISIFNKVAVLQVDGVDDDDVA